VKYVISGGNRCITAHFELYSLKISTRVYFDYYLDDVLCRDLSTRVYFDYYLDDVLCRDYGEIEEIELLNSVRQFAALCSQPFTGTARFYRNCDLHRLPAAETVGSAGLKR
jgi:hypothetical protein